MPYTITVNPDFKNSVHKIALGLVRYAARVAVGEIRQSMDKSPATGRTYPSRKGDGSTHRASAPGEAPAVDTKELRDSIAAAVTETNTGGVAIVGSNAYDKPVWRWLEFGTSRIKPRPSARPAFGVAMDKTRAMLKTGAGKSLKSFEGSFGSEVR